MGDHSGEDLLLVRALEDWDDGEQEDGVEDGPASFSSPLHSSSRGAIPLTVLPCEILSRVFSFLSADDLVAVSRVCSTFQSISSEDVLWR
jgi:hypothetical protein